VGTLLVVLVLDVHEQSFDVLGFGVGSVFVKCQVVVGKLALILADIFNQGFIFTLQSDVSGVVFVNVFDFLLHLLNLTGDFNVLLFHLIGIVVSIVDLAPGSCSFGIHSHHAVICYWSVDRVNFGVVANSCVVYFAHTCLHAGRCALSAAHCGSHPVV
jgi:hypothetical protein